MPKVFVINGTGGSGKSTFISYCKSFNPKVCEISAVDHVKTVAILAGWDGIKDERGRKFLADIKDAMDRYDDLSRKNVDKVIEENPNYIYFINARSPEDIEYFCNKWDGLSVLIINPRIPPITSNHADAKVLEYKYDVVIKNDGDLEWLRKKAGLFMNWNFGY